MTLFIHIGMQKTGSTFLQRALYGKREELAQKDLIYPDTVAGLGDVKEIPAHHFIPDAISGTRYSYTPSADFKLLEKHIQFINDKSKDGSTAVISSENFSRLTKDGISRLRSLITDSDVRIISYLRRQDIWLDSLYGQAIKSGSKMSVNTFFRKQYHLMHYFDVLKNWEDCFGKGSVIARPYEGCCKKNIWEDFMISIEREDLKLSAPTVDNANHSLSHEAASVMNALYIYGNPPHGMRLMLEELSQSFDNGESLKYLDENMSKSILDQFSRQNEMVAHHFMGRSQLFGEESKLPSLADSRLSQEQVLQILGGMIMKLTVRTRKLERKIRKLEENRDRMH